MCTQPRPTSPSARGEWSRARCGCVGWWHAQRTACCDKQQSSSSVISMAPAVSCCACCGAGLRRPPRPSQASASTHPTCHWPSTCSMVGAGGVQGCQGLGLRFPQQRKGLVCGCCSLVPAHPLAHLLPAPRCQGQPLCNSVRAWPQPERSDLCARTPQGPGVCLPHKARVLHACARRLQEGLHRQRVGSATAAAAAAAGATAAAGTHSQQLFFPAPALRAAAKPTVQPAR